MIETFSMVASMTNDRPLGASDAAAWLGDPGDLGGGLGRPLGEELVELLDGDAGGLAEHADGGAGSLGLVFGAHEPDDLPVPRREFVDALGLGDLWRHVLGPLAGFGEESFVVDGNVLAGVGSGGHVSTSWVRSLMAAGGGPGGIRHARAGLAAGGHGLADSGDVAAGKQAVPVELLEGELAEVVHAGLPQQGQAEAARVVAGERFGVVVEVDQQGPAEAGLDEAVGVAVEGGGQRLATQELVDVGGQHVAFEMGNGSCFGGRDVGGVAEGEHVGLYRGLERAGGHRNEAELVAESGGALDVTGAAVQRDDDGQVEGRVPLGVGDQAASPAAVAGGATCLDGAGVELGYQLDALVGQQAAQFPVGHGLGEGAVQGSDIRQFNAVADAPPAEVVVGEEAELQRRDRALDRHVDDVHHEPAPVPSSRCTGSAATSTRSIPAWRKAMPGRSCRCRGRAIRPMVVSPNGTNSRPGWYTC